MSGLELILDLLEAYDSNVVREIEKHVEIKKMYEHDYNHIIGVAMCFAIEMLKENGVEVNTEKIRELETKFKQGNFNR